MKRYFLNKVNHVVISRIDPPDDAQNWKEITKEEYIKILYGGRKWKRKPAKRK